MHSKNDLRYLWCFCIYTSTLNQFQISFKSLCKLPYNVFWKLLSVNVMWLGQTPPLRLRDPVWLWRSTAHAHGRFSMDFELMPLVLSSNLFFWTKNSVQCLWIWSYQRTVRWTMQGLTEPFEKYRCLLQFYRGEKSWGVYSFTGQGLFSKTERHFQKKNAPSGPQVG